MDDADAWVNLVALIDLDDVGDVVNHRARPLRCGPVVVVGMVRVLHLQPVHQHGGMVEEVEVLVVVPMGMGHDGQVDVLRGQATLLQSLKQMHPSANVAWVHQYALVPRSNQGDAAKAECALVAAKVEAIQQNIYGRRHMSSPK